MSTRREFIHQAALAGAGLGLLGNGACGDDGGPGTADALPDEGVPDGGPMMDARPPGADAMPDGRPMGDARPPMMDGAPPMMDGAPPMMDARPPMPDARPPVPDARPPRTDGSAMAVCGTISVRISFNHGHELIVPVADVRAGGGVTYDISGRSPHPHTVTITAEDCTALLRGRMVTKSSAGGAHVHEVTLRCVSSIRPAP